MPHGKRDKTFKGGTTCNQKPMHEWPSQEESASPTVSIKGTLLTMTIDANKERDMVTSNTPNAFAQASSKREKAKPELS